MTVVTGNEEEQERKIRAAIVSLREQLKDRPWFLDAEIAGANGEMILVLAELIGEHPMDYILELPAKWHGFRVGSRSFGPNDPKTQILRRR